MRAQQMLQSQRVRECPELCMSDPLENWTAQKVGRPNTGKKTKSVWKFPEFHTKYM